MSKKDYQAFAALFREWGKGFPVFRGEGFLDAFCEILEADNPNFDRDRFLAAVEE